MSFHRLLDHLSIDSVFIKYLINAAAAFAFSFLILFSFFASLSVSYLVNKEELSKLSLFGDYAAIIRENDLDDVLIHQKRMKIESLRRKADDLSEESVLFSALSFSAFLAIVVADKVDASQLLITDQKFTSFYQIFLTVVTGKVRETGIDVSFIARQNSLLFISILLLLCSMFFLCNIISLVRFNDRYRRAESLVIGAEWLNEKEEMLSDDDVTGMKQNYKMAILGLLESSDAPMKATNLPLLQMKIFRGLGITCFLMCGLVCANLFGGVVFLSIAAIILIGIFAEVADYSYHLLGRIWGGRENRLQNLFEAKK